MSYRGTINVDFSKFSDGNPVNGNEQNKLSLALLKGGWRRVETSAYVIDDPDVRKIWNGIALVAKQASSVGTLSALTFHVQLIALDPPGRPNCTMNDDNAFDEVSGKPFPG